MKRRISMNVDDFLLWQVDSLHAAYGREETIVHIRLDG